MARILAVEDEPDIALGLVDDLTVEGYSVTLVTDGATAVQRGREPAWDLILLDVMLPKKDGFDVCRELRARIKAVLRRMQNPGTPATYCFGDVEVDFSRAELRRGGEIVEITPLELKLLDTFIRRRGRVVSRDQLLDAAWPAGVHVTDRAVDAHIVNLRRKIEPKPAEPHYIVSVRGLGYRFEG